MSLLATIERLEVMAAVDLDELEARCGRDWCRVPCSKDELRALITELRTLRASAAEPAEVFNAGYKLALEHVRSANAGTPISWRCYLRDVVDAVETALPVPYPYTEKGSE